MKKRFLLILLLATASAQLAVPLHLAWRAETTLAKGTPVKFALRLYDPYDPMRGRYVRLNYDWGSFELSPADHARLGDARHLQVCARVAIDADGIGTIEQISLDPPTEGPWFRIAARRWGGGTTVHLDPPFDRYFVNEHEAAAAETIFREATRRPTPTAIANESADVTAAPSAPTANAFAVIRIRQGEAQLEDVLIEGRSLAALAHEDVTTGAN